MQLIDKVTVVGAGHAGRQIAVCLQAAGFRVCCFEKTEESLARAKQSSPESSFPELFIPDASGSRHSLAWTSDLSIASQADLLIETVTENLSVKREAVRPFFDLCPPITIFVSNSSYLLPSSIFAGIPQPERTAALHFHLPIWFARAVDVMPSSRTSSDTLESLAAVVYRMGLTPIRLRREYPGYVFNTLLHPLLIKSLELAERGVCSPAEVDLSWREITHMSVGPFGMMQQIGLPTLRTIVERAASVTSDPSTQRALAYLAKWDGKLENTDPRSTLTHKPLDLSAFSGTPQVTTDSSAGVSRTEGGLRRFQAYQVDWMKSFAGSTQDDSSNLQTIPSPPTSGRSDSSRKRWLVAGESRLAAQLRKLLQTECEPAESDSADSTEHISANLVVVIDPTIECDSQQTWSDHLALQIRMLRDWFAKRSIEDSNHSCLVVIAPLNELGRPTRRAWGLAGMLKAAWLETIQSTPNGLRADNVRLLEVDYYDPHACTAITGYINHHNGDVLAGVDPKQLADLHHRYTLGQYQRPYLKPLQIARSTSRRPETAIHGSRWLITGGARGITYRLAFELAKQGASLHLLGRTSAPTTRWYEFSNEAIKEARQDVCRNAYRSGISPAVASNRFDAEVELSKNLHELSRSGVEFDYHVADVTSAEAIRTVASEIRNSRGQIEGFLHGAGIEQTIRLEKKPESVIEQTLRTKVEGAQLLSQLIDRATRWFIQCGSLSGFFGGIGQIDYAAANGLLAELSESIMAQRQDLQALTIAWPGWEGVGMAARPASSWALRKSGHELMSIQEGVQHFVDLLHSGASGQLLLINPDEIPEVFLAPLSQTSGTSGA